MEKKNQEKNSQLQSPEYEERKEAKRFFETSIDISAIDQNETVKQDQFEADSVLDGSNLLQQSQEENMHNESTFQDPITVIDQEQNQKIEESQEVEQPNETFNDRITELSIEETSSYMQKAPSQDQLQNVSEVQETKEINQQEQSQIEEKKEENQISIEDKQIQQSQESTQKQTENEISKQSLPQTVIEQQETKKQISTVQQVKIQKQAQQIQIQQSPELTSKSNVHKNPLNQSINIYYSYEDFLAKTETASVSKSQNLQIGSRKILDIQNLQELKQKAEQKRQELQKMKDEKKKLEIEQIKQAAKERDILRQKKQEAAIYIQKI